MFKSIHENNPKINLLTTEMDYHCEYEDGKIVIYENPISKFRQGLKDARFTDYQNQDCSDCEEE